MKLNYKGYEVTGTPAEILELVNLSGGGNCSGSERAAGT